jgi:hypothetical protein
VRAESSAQVTEVHAGKATIITVREAIIRADFVTELDYLATLPADHSPTSEQWAETEQLRTRATAVADRTLRAFLDMCAVLRRLFGLHLEEGPIVTLGRPYVGRPPNPILFGTPALNLVVTTGSHGLTADDARQVRSKLQLGRTLPLGWLEYLEAHRRLFISRDPRPAVVEAATAVELGLKDALRRRRRGSKTIALLLKTDRLRDLLKEVADAVLGQSYAVADKNNYDKVVALIEQRHALVHRGQEPNRKELEGQLEAALRLLEWLDVKAPW